MNSNLVDTAYKLVEFHEQNRLLNATISQLVGGEGVDPIVFIKQAQELDRIFMDLVSQVQISKLPGRRFNAFVHQKLPTGGAIYFLCRGKRVMYVGKSHKLRSRWRAHHVADRCERGDIIRWMEMPGETLVSLEHYFIRHFNPRFNTRQG